jgi:hypothetical protein
MSVERADALIQSGSPRSRGLAVITCEAFAPMIESRLLSAELECAVMAWTFDRANVTTQRS